MIQDHHRAAVESALASALSYIVHVATPCGGGKTFMDIVEQWVHLIGGIGAALAGFASAIWYGYSFVAAWQRRNKGP